jgi:hypothetical protein
VFNPLRVMGRWLATYLNQPVTHSEPFLRVDGARLIEMMQPADVLLVEGDTRVSTAIKYLTQSTWSHSALYIGDALGEGLDPDTAPTLLEADLKNGVAVVPLSKYTDSNLRICRAVGLTPEDQARVVAYATARIGMEYDLKNLVDLARYLFPIPPVPTFMRRRMLALGSGDPTRALCSTLIAQAFQSVRFPILPLIETLDEAQRRAHAYRVNEILHIRHHSLFAPRDFDLSPFFEVIKPMLADFDYQRLVWGDQICEVPTPPGDSAGAGDTNTGRGPAGEAGEGRPGPAD